jgi:hypothetical protein
MIICPFHSERTPSGSINVSPGYAPGSFRCFACGYEASWNELAPKINLLPYGKVKPQAQHSLDLMVDRLAQDLLQDKKYVPFKGKRWPLPKNKKWRSISTNLLIQLDGQLCRRRYDWGLAKERMLYFPVMVNGEQEGYFLARIKKSANADAPSYLLAKKTTTRGWSRTHGLWPFDYAIKMMSTMSSNTVVLVEGQRDALRLLLEGIPAMCIFGTQSWSDSKAKLLEAAGVNRVILMFDGDDAGIQATQKIRLQVSPWFVTKLVKLWNIKGSPYLKFKNHEHPSKAAKKAEVSLWDPMNCPQWILDNIKSQFF